MKDAKDDLAPHLVAGDGYDSQWYRNILVLDAAAHLAHRKSMVAKETKRRMQNGLPPRNCPSCNASAEVHAKFCRHCGQALADPFTIPDFAGPKVKERPSDPILAERYDKRIGKARSELGKLRLREMEDELMARWDEMTRR